MTRQPFRVPTPLERRLKLARAWWEDNKLRVALWASVVFVVGWGWM